MLWSMVLDPETNGRLLVALTDDLDAVCLTRDKLPRKPFVDTLLRMVTDSMGHNFGETSTIGKYAQTILSFIFGHLSVTLTGLI